LPGVAESIVSINERQTPLCGEAAL